MKRNIIIPKSHEEWLEHRKSGIGSSEVGTILGVNPFSTPYKLWRLKKGYDQPVEENEAMLMGHLMEDAVAQRWQIATGNKIINASAEEWIYVHPVKDYFRASPDRIFWSAGDKHNEANKKILECKTTLHSVDVDELPKYWFCQVMWLMHVTGYKEASLAWIQLNTRTFGYVDLKYDEHFCKWMEDEVEKFWKDCIIAGKEPELKNAEDVKLKYPTEMAGKVIQANGELLNQCRSLQKIKASIAELDAKKKHYEDAIKLQMQDAEIIQLNDEKLVTWKSPKPGIKFFEKEFAKDHPDLYAEYCYDTQGARRFLVK